MSDIGSQQPDDRPDDDPASTGQPSEGPSGLQESETASGGADAVPDTPDNVPADGV